MESASRTIGSEETRAQTIGIAEAFATILLLRRVVEKALRQGSAIELQEVLVECIVEDIADLCVEFLAQPSEEARRGTVAVALPVFNRVRIERTNATKTRRS